jgi:hypothetical protein
MKKAQENKKEEVSHNGTMAAFGDFCPKRILDKFRF